LKNVSNASGSVGIRLKELDSLNTLGGGRDLQYAQTLSNLQDLDYNKALSDLTRQQMALQAAQKTFTQTSSLSLFNYIN
jgi:flagellar hook-associated protein 3 FlgL